MPENIILLKGSNYHFNFSCIMSGSSVFKSKYLLLKKKRLKRNDGRGMSNVESLDSTPHSVLERKLKLKMILTLQIIFVFFIMLLSKDLPMEWATN